MTYKIVKETSYDEKGHVTSTNYYIYKLLKVKWYIRILFLFVLPKEYWKAVGYRIYYSEGSYISRISFDSEYSAQIFVERLLNDQPINTTISEDIKIVSK